MNKQDTVLMLTKKPYFFVDKALSYIMLNNKANFLPYHNLAHCMNVSGWAYDITRHLYPQEYKLQCLMALSGLFHDFDHSGGIEKDDTVNIQNAIKGFDKFLTESQILLSDADADLVRGVIKYTRFPLLPIQQSDTELSGVVSFETLVGIIRDADLLQLTCDSFVPQVMCGLAKELNIELSQFIKNQRSFIEGIKWNTPIVARYMSDKNDAVTKVLHATKNDSYNTIMWRIYALEKIFDK